MKTFYNQRDLKDQLTLNCHVTVVEITGDLARSRVTKTIISNDKTRNVDLCFLN